MSYIQWIGISPLAQEYVIKTPKGKGKGQAKVKKMVVADPGLGVEVSFEPDEGEQWKNVKLRFDLYVTNAGDPIPGQSTAPTHFVEFGIHNEDVQLQLPATYSFVVPFADQNWEQEMDEGKNLYFRFRFAVEEPTSEWGHGAIEGLPANSLAATQKFDYEPHGAGEPHTIGSITYSFITKNAGAVAWHENYYNDATYTSIRDNQTAKEAYFLPFDTLGGIHSPISENVACLLPVPKLTSGLPEMDILRTNNGSNNWDYDLSQSNPIEGAIGIKLVNSSSN